LADYIENDKSSVKLNVKPELDKRKAGKQFLDTLFFNV
jgi:hypothetical protein